MKPYKTEDFDATELVQVITDACNCAYTDGYEQGRADERAKVLDDLIDISHHCLVISELRSVMIDMRNSIK